LVFRNQSSSLLSVALICVLAEEVKHEQLLTEGIPLKRTIYLACSIALALIAALVTLRVQHTIAVVVPTHDMSVGSVVQSSDIEIKRMHDDNVPSGAITTTDEVNGHYVSWPLTAGEPILSRTIRTDRSGSNITTSFAVPNGYRAIAVAVQPANAVGGVIQPGDRVDVYSSAAKSNGDQSTTSPPVPSQAKRIGQDILVLELRSDQGQSMTPTNDNAIHGLSFGAGKLGSVVLAVAETDVSQYAIASADNFYLALSIK
jgi:Flp pilus assembly protein CpaB